MSHGTSDLVGQLVAQRYRIESVIGHGGQGVVYRARDVKADRAVALKVLTEAVARDPQAAGRFTREQDALHALAGTAAVQAYDAGEMSEGGLYLVLELLEGRDLEHELAELEQRGELMSLTRIAELMTPVAETLDIARREGIFHRDLKPANIYVLDRGGVRLLDFGFARLRTSRKLTADGTIVGSPCYIAPEVWAGRSDLVDHRADAYGLGVILFRMLTGKVPFESPSILKVYEMATTGPRPSLRALRAELPEAIDAWVQRALAIDREQRYQSTAECLEELFAALGAAHVLAPIQRTLRQQWDEQRASAAQRIAHVIQSAAAAITGWAAKIEARAEAVRGPRKPRSGTR